VKLFFLARSLNAGGAERQLVALARELSERGHDISVAVFYSGGLFERELRDSRIEWIDLKKRGRWDIVPFLFRLFRAVRRGNPDVIYAFLGVPNMLTALLKPYFNRVRMVWGVRASSINLGDYDRATQFSYVAEPRLSRFADLVICNSQAGMRDAIRRGFPEEKMIVVPNGIDTERFRLDLQGRARVREEWCVDDSHILVGLPARLDPMKDHPTFLRAAALLTVDFPTVRFVCIGGGDGAYGQGLRHLASSLGLKERVIWSGPRRDMPAVYSALDLAVSSSYCGEGFSNVIGEAMACSLPCVVTDVGDAREIVGNCGRVVPPQDPRALYEALRDQIRAGPTRPTALRERIGTLFSVGSMAEKTQQALSRLVQ